MHCSMAYLTSPRPAEQTDMLLRHRLLNREFTKSAPITLGEFQTALSKSRPSAGWGKTLGTPDPTANLGANFDSAFRVYSGSLLRRR
jgi:hypothetical protein